MPQRRRRSFSQPNLEARQEGPLGALLAAALHMPKETGYTLTHAFHPYPGRFHPHLPRTLLRGLPAEAGLATPGTRVLDPFMGGGTALVEARLAGLPCIGNDLNPIAVLVARERTRPRTQAQALQVLGEARRIAGQVQALRREKNPPRVQLPGLQRLTPHYAPHLLAELMQWIRLIDGLPEGAVRQSLRAVFSSAVVKYSNQATDSTPEERKTPTIAKGAPSRFLVLKTEELVQSQLDLGRLLGAHPAPVRLLEEDARLLPSLGWGEADLALTSPPYPGTYDYYLHHRLRLDWLGLDGQALLDAELFPRRAQLAVQRAAAKATHAAAPPVPHPTPKGRRKPEAQPVPARPKRGDRSLSSDWRDMLVALARVLKPEGAAFLVIGDWMDEGHAVDGGAVLTRAAQDKGWHVASSASARRLPHSKAEHRAFLRRGKWEHLLHMVRK